MLDAAAGHQEDRFFRRFFYSASLFLAGSCLVLMTLLIWAGVLARLFGQLLPSSEDIAGWLLSATIFFGLAYTFRSAGHIRVIMVLQNLSVRKRRWLDIANLTLGAVISGYLALYTAVTVYDSYDFSEVTDTYLVIPLYLIQLPMAIGSLFLFIALLDSLWELCRKGRSQSLSSDQPLSREKL